jgi:hypothetical protein
MLTGPERLKWVDAFFDAFSPQEFDDLLAGLDDRIGNYVSDMRPPKVVIGEVIAAYSRRNEEDRLIAAAVALRPGDESLARLARRPTDPLLDTARFERLIVETNSFLDINAWLNAAASRQACVCRIELERLDGTRSFGTGFLVGPDLVMTAFHVLHPVVLAESSEASDAASLAKASSVVCRFDYAVLPAGMTHAGAEFALADDWRVALGRTPSDGLPATIDRLDYAIVRLARPAGELPVVGAGPWSRPRRGWIALPTSGIRHPFQRQSPLFMIQHPKAGPIKLALETNAIHALDPNRVWVRYRTNSESGSSGSPCFDQNWNLIALHHSSDTGPEPAYNEGIPIDTIVAHLTHHGMAGSITFDTVAERM